jgi:hypothetical protein
MKNMHIHIRLLDMANTFSKVAIYRKNEQKPMYRYALAMNNLKIELRKISLTIIKELNIPGYGGTHL